MSVPLLGRLTCPQIDAFDGARAEAAECGDDLGGVVEEVGPVGLAVEQDAAGAELHVEPLRAPNKTA